jgi:RHS repeat-associated protein
LIVFRDSLSFLRPLYSLSRPVTETAIGTLGGDFSVNASGAATYSIDLQVPPGTAGAAPALQIVYNSQASEGVLGQGFTLTGISSITRCAASNRIDGFFGGIYFDERDRFCLDGQRLVKVSGGGGYQAPGSVYHTQQETWTRVVAVGTCGSGPCSFVAWNKDGTRLGFGENANSRISLPNRLELVSWMITQSSDVTGNTVAVSYEQHPSTLQIEPSEIRYTSNAPAGVQPQRSVKFTYETRTDVIAKYVGGYLFQQTERLHEIHTSVDGSPVITYSFNYNYSSGTGESLLANIRKCSADGLCFPATIFTWQQEANSVVSPNSDPRGQLRTNWCTESGASIAWIDFNGDGRPDVHCDTPSGVHRVLLSTGNGLISPNSSPDGVIRTGWAIGTRTTLIDFNGDGKGDLASDGPNGSHWVLVSDGKTVSTPNSHPDGLVRANWCSGDDSRVTWGNFNADGRADLLCSSPDGTQRALVSDGHQVASPNSNPDGVVKTSWCSEPDAFSFWADFNGDRLSDNHCSTSGGVQRVLLSTGTTLVSPNADPQGTVKTGWCAGNDRHRGATDFNGDGLIDSYCSSDDGRDWVLLSKGTGLISPNSNGDGLIKSAWCAGSDSTRGWADFNADGLSDLTCSQSNGRQLVLLSTGSAVHSPNSSPEGVILSSWCNQNGGRSEQTDFNGDGLGDFTCHDSSGSQFAMIHKPGFPDLVTSITDGLGLTINITYKPLTDPSVYTKGSAVVWPILDVVTPQYVVASNSTSDGRGSNYIFDHQYSGARTDMEARRWLGFKTVTTIERAGGRISEVEYIQEYPVTGFAASSSVYDRNRILQARSEQNPHVITPYPNVNQVLIGQATTSTFTNGVADFRNVKIFSYDKFGNLELLIDSNTPDRSDAIFSCYKYEEDEGLWRLGYLREDKVTRTEQGCLNFLSSLSPQWDPQADLRWNATEFDSAMNPKVTKTWDDRNNVWIETKRTFDAVGNIVDLSDPAGNTTTYKYDSDLTFPLSQTSPTLSGGLKMTLLFRHNRKFGAIESTTDPNGNEQIQILDGFGRVSEIRGPDPASSSGSATVTLKKVSYGRDAGGQYNETRERQTWEDGNSENWFYTKTYVDGMGRPFRQATRSQRSEIDIVNDTLFDPQGREWKSSFPHYSDSSPSFTETSYDSLNRPITVLLPDGTVQKNEYLRGALEVRTTEAFGTTEARTTLSFSSPRLNLIKSINPDQFVATWEYDNLSQLKKVTRPNGAIATFDYDSLGRQVRSLDADTGINTWAFAPNGLLRSSTDGAGNLTTFEYDSLNRVIKSSSQPETGPIQTFVFGYDEHTVKNGLGNLTSVRGAHYDEVYSYTRYNLVDTERLTLDGEPYLDSMGYDAAGRPSSRTFPDGSVERTSYYVNGLTQKVEIQERGTGPFTTYAEWSDYDALGQPGSLVYGNKLTKKYTYYPVPQGLGRLHTWNLTRPDGGSLSAASYDWNRHDQITKVAQSRDGGAAVEETFDHNKMGWLKVAKGPWGTFQYDYDPSGNIKLKNGVSFDYKPSTDLLKSNTANAQFDFDGAGNQTRKKLPDTDWKYEFNADGRLTKVMRDGSPVGEHIYDSNGRRLKRVDSQGNISRYISEDFDTFESESKTLLTKYVTGDAEAVAAITTEATPSTLHKILRQQRDLRERSLFDPYSAAGFPRWFGAAARPFIPLRLAGLNERVGLLLLVIAAVIATGLTLLSMFIAKVRRLRAKAHGGLSVSIYLRRHPVYGRIVPLVIVALLIATVPREVFAQLGPGEGYPTPGVLYLHGNQLDSTLLVTGPQGEPLTRLAYNPYGEISQERSSGRNNFRPKFTTKEWDHSSELYYYGARYYDPTIGRFLSADPASQFFSPYTYVNNDPQTNIDPSGEFVEMIVMIVIGAVVGAYFGGVAVNHTYNPFLWDWSSGRNLAGIFAGAAIGAAAAAITGLAAEAGVAAGIVGSIIAGAGENAAFTALGGGSAKEIVESAAIGGVMGALGGVLGALGSGASRAGRVAAAEAVELADSPSATASRLGKRAQTELGDSDSPEASAFSPCSSFPAGTLVAVPRGFIPVEDVRTGTPVLGQTSDDAAPASFKAGQVTSRFAPSLVAVRAGGVTIEATPLHRFWVTTRGWIGAADLHPGDPLLSANGSTIPVEAIVPVWRPGQVYNFEVVKAETYFVSPLRILVHNPHSCRLSKLPPTRTQKSPAQKKKWEAKIKSLVLEFGDKTVTYEDPPVGRRLLDLDPYAFVIKGKRATVSLTSFGKGSTRPQHFAFADKTFATTLKVAKFDRGAQLRGQYQTAMKGTWHHDPFTKRVTFVPTRLHSELGHQGGFKILF